MKISNSNGPFWYRGSMKEALVRMKELGYEAFDWQIHDIKADIYHDDAAMEAYCREVKEAAEAAGMEVHQAHGPWPTDDTTEESRAEGWRCFHRAVYMCHLAGCPYLIIHPQMPFGWSAPEDPETAEQITVDLMKDLMPDCEKYGVTLCLENMPFTKQRISTMDRIAEAVAKVGSPHVGICMDTGHVNVFPQDLGDMVRIAAPYLKCVHVHDNDGTRDSHELPWWGTANWEGFVKALAEVGYEGTMNLECSGKFPDRLPLPLRETTETITAATARYLADQVEAEKRKYKELTI